jgi:hypothetical protein
MKSISRSFRIFLLFGIAIIWFYSCKKADINPYAINAPGSSQTTPADTTPTFKASVSSSSIISFTPGKSIVGSNTTLIGTNSTYTVTITFPNSIGQGSNYEMGFGGPGITAELINGVTKYKVNNSWGSGQLTIDSISSKGKYYGSFLITAQDTVTFDIIDVSQGSFYHL